MPNDRWILTALLFFVIKRINVATSLCFLLLIVRSLLNLY